MTEKKISMFDSSVGAFRELPKSLIIKNIKEAKKLEKKLLAQGVITEKEVAID